MNSSMCNIIYQWNVSRSWIQCSQADPLYILRGQRLYFPNTVVFLSMKISFVDPDDISSGSSLFANVPFTGIQYI